MPSLRTGNSYNLGPQRALGQLREISPRKGRLKMLTEMNVSQFRNWLNVAKPDDLVSVAPLLFSRIGALDKPHQEDIMEEVRSNPQAKSVFKKFSTFIQ